MAGPNKDLFKRALSRIASKGNAPQAPSGSANWQGVQPASTAPATPAPAPPAPAPAPAPRTAPAAPVLREDDLIAQIEAEEEALMSIGGGAPPPIAAAPTPAAAPRPTPAPAPTPVPSPAAPAPAPAPSNSANGAAGARTAREAAAAMAARLAARRGASPAGVGNVAASADTPPTVPAVAKPAPSVSAPPPEEKIPADDCRAGADRRSGGDRRREDDADGASPAVTSSVPFATLSPISAAERKGGLGATFVPAAGPIPFAHIGAFRWLMPTQAAVLAKVTESADGGAAPAKANGHASAAPPIPASALEASPAPTPAPPAAPPPAPAADPSEDFLQKLNFNDLTPSPAQAAAVAAIQDPLAKAKDRDGDGMVGLSDVLEPPAAPAPADDVMSMDFGGAPAAPSPMPAPTPAPAPATRAPTAARPEHAAPTPAHAHGAAPPVADPQHASPLHAHAPQPARPTPPPAPAPSAAGVPAGSPADLLRNTIASLGNQVRERDDIARIVLGYATQRFRRAALFVIKKEMLVGWEGGGTEISRAAVRGIMVPLTNPSIFKTVFETKVLYCGGVPHTTVNDIFFNALGDPRPERVVVVPFVLKDKVACVLYADGGDIDDENPDSIERAGGERGVGVRREAERPTQDETIGELYQLGRAVSSAFENLILRAKRS